MKIIFTEHAKHRMLSRSISKVEVINTLFHPDGTSTQGAKTLAKKIRNNGQLLIVCHVYREGYILVITVVSTSKLTKYLK